MDLANPVGLAPLGFWRCSARVLAQGAVMSDEFDWAFSDRDEAEIRADPRRNALF
jgi:hypothetical protein